MRLKHWAYIGMVLAVSHESLLGGVRAAEIMIPPPPVPVRTPSLINKLHALLETPQKKVLSPVLVRLFASETTQNLWLKHPKGLILSGRRVKGTIFVTLKKGQVQAFSGKHRFFAAKQLKVTALNDLPYTIKNRQGVIKSVTGELRISIVKGRLKVINRMELEDYVAGILEGELGSIRLSPELLKAQIVVARSYVLSQRGERHPRQGFEFCDLPHCQVFRGVAAFDTVPGLEKILSSTRGQYISYKGRPISAFYHHNCGGKSSSADEVWPMSKRSYLIPVAEDARGICRVSPSSEWQARLGRKKLTTCFRNAGWLRKNEAIADIQIVETDGSGRVKRIAIIGKKTTIMSVGRFRNVINQYFGGELLKSALFTVTVGKEFCFVRGRGWGHGVGFCQEGARWLAEKGTPYKDILLHYFPNTTLEQL